MNRPSTSAAGQPAVSAEDDPPVPDREVVQPGAPVGTLVPPPPGHRALAPVAPGVSQPPWPRRPIYNYRALPEHDYRRGLWPWLVSRLVALLILIPEHVMLWDVIHYGFQIRTIASPTGLRGVLPEYPAPSLLVIGPAWWAARGNWYAYLATFVVLMIAVDAVFTVALWRSGGRRVTAGFWLWILVGPLLGPLVYARFDLVPAVLAGGALLAMTRRPGTAGMLAAAGAAVKLWPVALLPALLAEPRRGARLRAVAGFVAVGAVAVAGTVVAGGVDRLRSPLTWQGDRGLQIESLFAVPLLIARLVSPSTWATPYTRFYAFQVDGPGATALADLSTVVTVVGFGLLAWLWWRVLRRRPATGDVRALAGLLMTATAGLLVITNRTLSPQYLIWIGALLAALGCLAPAEPEVPRLIRLLLIGCGMTHVIYPIGYALLTNETWATWIGVLLLTARNGLLLAVTVIALRRVVALTRRAPAGQPV